MQNHDYTTYCNNCGCVVNNPNYYCSKTWCDRLWCSSYCAEAGGYKMINNTSTCGFCREEMLEDTPLLYFILEKYGLDAEALTKEYYAQGK